MSGDKSGGGFGLLGEGNLFELVEGVGNLLDVAKDVIDGGGDLLDVVSDVCLKDIGVGVMLLASLSPCRCPAFRLAIFLMFRRQMKSVITTFFLAISSVGKRVL